MNDTSEAAIDTKEFFAGGPFAGFISQGGLPEGCNIHVTCMKIDHKDGLGRNTIPLRGTYFRDKENPSLLHWHEYP